jgi:spore coat polysaccharide biosynthesis protein SpsF (cytidylyltransferase family)
MHDEVVNVLIAIQARSTSTRFPGKVFEKIGEKSVLDLVLEAADDSRYFLMEMFKRRAANGNFLDVKVCLVIPEGDKIKEVCNGKVDIVEGSEMDVLARYKKAFDLYHPQYLVRITGDCPIIPPYVISTHVKQAVKMQADYVQNVDPLTRTSPDGWDCEVLSARAFSFLCEFARTPNQREHVTLALRENPPKWAKIWHCIGYKDDSGHKISFDTEEDRVEIIKQYDAVKRKIKTARDLGHGVFRL